MWKIQIAHNKRDSNKNKISLNEYNIRESIPYIMTMYSDINFSCRRDFKRNGCKTINLFKLNLVSSCGILQKDKKK